MDNLNSIQGKSALVLGGSRGIGAAIARRLAAGGASVAVTYVQGAAPAQALVDEIGKAGGRAIAIQADSADPEAVVAAVERTVAELGGIDILVNNATAYGMVDDEDGWAKSLGVDLLAAVRASRAALPWLRQSDDASILHTASIAAFHASPRSAPYAAAKAALIQYTTSQALTLAKDRIRVNAIAPGSIEFDDGLWDRRRESDPELYAKTLARIPFGRFGRPEEIANAALLLSSSLAGWITGQTLSVDGGQLLNS
jgi:3-oxoacyl-[acyl-carrier protein] reductase